MLGLHKPEEGRRWQIDLSEHSLHGMQCHIGSGGFNRCTSLSVGSSSVPVAKMVLENSTF